MEVMLIPIPKRIAKERGLKTYYPGFPCSNGHVAPRKIGAGRCIVCRSEYDRLLWERRRDDLVAKNRRYYAENKDAVNAQKRQYWSKNRERMKAARLQWKQANAHIVRHLNTARKSRIKIATPPWADLEAIKAVYAEARRLTNETGVFHHVDHVIPINGDLVCGLHVHWNLRPLPWRENISKKNKLLESS